MKSIKKFLSILLVLGLLLGIGSFRKNNSTQAFGGRAVKVVFVAFVALFLTEVSNLFFEVDKNGPREKNPFIIKQTPCYTTNTIRKLTSYFTKSQEERDFDNLKKEIKEEASRQCFLQCSALKSFFTEESKKTSIEETKKSDAKCWGFCKRVFCG